MTEQVAEQLVLEETSTIEAIKVAVARRGPGRPRAIPLGALEAVKDSRPQITTNRGAQEMAFAEKAISFLRRHGLRDREDVQWLFEPRIKYGILAQLGRTVKDKKLFLLCLKAVCAHQKTVNESRAMVLELRRKHGQLRVCRPR